MTSAFCIFFLNSILHGVFVKVDKKNIPPKSNIFIFVNAKMQKPNDGIVITFSGHGFTANF